MEIISLGSLLISGYLVFRILVRRDYLHLGRLSPLVSFLELVVWLLVVIYPSFYNPADWWWVWFAKTPTNLAQKSLGSLLVLTGMGLAVLAMTRLGMDKTFGRKMQGLYRDGLYRNCRNPQLVGGGLAVAGIVILWPSAYALAWAFAYGLIGRWMVLSEEEHLGRLYKSVYAQYCQQVPRFWFRRIPLKREDPS
jgi:protein-S-isoprenylcysteine O-methyltransferase Ste14